jgi:copper chaperone CopZ
MVKHTFRVLNMECPNCAMRLEGLEDKLAGVKQINASYRKMEMVVEFDEHLLSDQQIIKAAEEEGYEAVPVS